MIRNVVMFRLKPEATAEQLDAVVRAMKAIPFAGCTRWELVRDLGLREGNMPYAFVAEFEDVRAYRAYDGHEEHNRIRREMLAPIVERLERIQYQVG